MELFDRCCWHKFRAIDNKICYMLLECEWIYFHKKKKKCLSYYGLNGLTTWVFCENVVFNLWNLKVIFVLDAESWIKQSLILSAELVTINIFEM